MDVRPYSFSIGVWRITLRSVSCRGAEDTLRVGRNRRTKSTLVKSYILEFKSLLRVLQERIKTRGNYRFIDI